MDSVDKLSQPKPTTPECTAYGYVPGKHNAKLVEVMPGTPCGEYLRRYWHPIALSSEVGRRPQKVKVLGEDLILFRDGAGKPGLLYPRCAHRGTNLYYGKTEEHGIRCCYHGWVFDAEGHCLEQPCEENGGSHRDRIRQPWYPLQERYGLVFTYMGPPERMPFLPRYDIFEDLQPGYQVFPQRVSGYADLAVDAKLPVPYNWLQVFENGADPFHVMILHSTFSDYPQFGEAYKVRPNVEFEALEASILNHAKHSHNGRMVDQVEELLLPNMKALYPMSIDAGRGRRITWHTPVDDTSFVKFGATVGRERLVEFDALIMTPQGKTWSQMTDDEHQVYPGDYEAQASQGLITLHSEEHLARSDIGVVMLRRMLLKEIDAVAAGKDPSGVAFTEEDALVHIGSGNFYLD